MAKILIMKPFALSISLLCITLLFSCKADSKKEEPIAQAKTADLTILEKVAHAHGYGDWKNVEQVSFTFNVDRNGNHFQRSWQWNTKTNDVVYRSLSDTLTYNRNQMDSIAHKTNSGFINDKYWLLAPFNLIWDNHNFEHQHTENESAPLSGKPMQKLTIVYKNEGGYTPGDAYDFYFEDDFLIKEWVFRKGNSKEPSMATTWESYVDTLGIKLAKEHKMPDGNFNLYFDGLLLETSH